MSNKFYDKDSLGLVAWKLCILAILCLMIVFTALAARAANADSRFVQQATIGNQFEIESSRLAVQKSGDDAVKNFAQQMIDDHTRIRNDLKATLARSQMDTPVPHNKLDAKHAELLEKLRDANGDAFDKAYLNAQVDAHKQAVALFRDYAATSTQPALKDFAAKTLPVIEGHKEELPHI